MRLMKIIAEVFDPIVIISFIGICGFIMVIDIPGHRSRGLQREARFFKALSLITMGLFTALLFTILVFKWSNYI